MISSFRRLPSLSVLVMTFIFALQAMPALAADPYINLDFGLDTMMPLTIGRTTRLGISVVNASSNPIRATSLVCTPQDTSLSASSISRLPNSSILAPGSTFSTEQYYRAVSAGSTFVTCVFKGTDTVTGASLTITSSSASVEVVPDQGLSVQTYSNTQSASVGEIITLTIVYHNHNQKTFTMVDSECGVLGRGIAFIGKTQTQSTVPPGQSGFIQYRLQGVFSGAGGLYLCSATAIDSSTNQKISVPGTPVSIVIR